MNIADCIAWWRFTHPELFAGWVGLLLVDVMIWIALVILEASESASACKIENEQRFIEWRW